MSCNFLSWHGTWIITDSHTDHNVNNSENIKLHGNCERRKKKCEGRVGGESVRIFKSCFLII